MKVGETKEAGITKKYEFGLQNEWGERFIEWCNSYNQVITNTFF